MKAAMTGVLSALGRRKLLASSGAFAALAALAAAFLGGDALAQNAGECARLQQAIAQRHGSSGVQAAAERQRAELARTTAYARSLGCENHKFLFLGSDPPAQCGQVNGQIARMQANLADLQAREGGGAGDLVARYNAECLNAPARPTNIFEALFGGVARLVPLPQMDAREEPLDRGEEGAPNQALPGEKGHVEARSGSYAVCVRTCDGSFFPVSYTGAGSRADSLEEVCRALCPNADMALYSFPFGGTIDEAASSSNGEPYANLPNAGKFQQTYDPNCSCRRKGQGWADALADAEARYGHEKHDILVTPEKSAEMARPIVDPKAKSAADPKAKAATPGAEPPVDPGGAQVLDANGTDTKLSAAAAAVSREGSGIAGSDTQGAKSFTVNQGRTVEITGPDGVKRLVRIVGPTL
jgi:hypothetical protein